MLLLFGWMWYHFFLSSKEFGILHLPKGTTGTRYYPDVAPGKQVEDVGVPSSSRFQSGLATLLLHPQGTVHNVRDPDRNVPPIPQVQPGHTLF